jgi:hypothetical protein
MVAFGKQLTELGPSDNPQTFSRLTPAFPGLRWARPWPAYNLLDPCTHTRTPVAGSLTIGREPSCYL